MKVHNAIVILFKMMNHSPKGIREEQTPIEYIQDEQTQMKILIMLVAILIKVLMSLT
jgi:hypothetical protein